MVDHVMRWSVVEPRIELVNDGLETDDGEKTWTETCQQNKQKQIQLNPAITDVKEPTNFNRNKRISVRLLLPTKKLKENDRKGP